MTWSGLPHHGVRLPQLDPDQAPRHLRTGWLADQVREGLGATNQGWGTTVLAGATPVRVRDPAEDSMARDSADPDLLDTSTGMPDLSASPPAAWVAAERHVLATATHTELGYADPQAALPLRAALAGWLARSRWTRGRPGGGRRYGSTKPPNVGVHGTRGSGGERAVDVRAAGSRGWAR